MIGISKNGFGKILNMDKKENDQMTFASFLSNFTSSST
jgi:hypothetical protein